MSVIMMVHATAAARITARITTTTGTDMDMVIMATDMDTETGGKPLKG